MKSHHQLGRPLRTTQPRAPHKVLLVHLGHPVWPHRTDHSRTWALAVKFSSRSPCSPLRRLTPFSPRAAPRFSPAQPGIVSRDSLI